MARGLSNSEIAAHAFLSELTVKTHVSRILMKHRLGDRVQAVVYAYENGPADVEHPTCEVQPPHAVSQACHAFAEPGGNRRTREDTAYAGVRDREGPGSNPGPPTRFRIQNRRFLVYV
jgi:hypothetical protein